MKPYYLDEAVTIYHGDCREIFPYIASSALVLTDPPYGTDIKYDTYDDSRGNLMELIGFISQVVIPTSRRTLITCGNGNQHLYPPPTWTLAWVIGEAGAGRCSWGFLCWQPILAYGKDPYLAAGMGGRPDSITLLQSSPDTIHPCPKPMTLWRKLIMRASVDKSEVIVDPFMGSGTTLRAAKDLGYKAIGIDVSEAYCEEAAKRMSQMVMELT